LYPPGQAASLKMARAEVANLRHERPSSRAGRLATPGLGSDTYFAKTLSTGVIFTFAAAMPSFFDPISWSSSRSSCGFGAS
jgi:hypothetical protein